MIDPRSLRTRALLVVIAVVVGPLAWVWLAGTFEDAGLLSLRVRLHEAVLEASDPSNDLAALAREHTARVRVIEGSEVVQDHDASLPNPWWAPVTDPFYGPDGRPTTDRTEAALPALWERDEVKAASTEPMASCVIAEQGLLLVCAATMTRTDGSIVHVQRSSPRLVRSLYERRFQLAALTGVVLAIGIGLALWLGWRLVRPIEQLREQVQQRTAAGATAKPIVLETNDPEFQDLALAFNRLMEQLDERNASNAEFAADLAHELKNPVAAIAAAADAMSSDRPIEGQRKERLQRILADSSARMEQVVTQFLDLARAEAGLRGNEREPVQLDELTRALITTLATDPRHSEISFSHELTPAVAALASERIETAIRNLLANAAHFAGPGGWVRVVLSVGTDAVLEVSDSGPGVAPEDRAQIFDRYMSKREGGTGLGLPLCAAIVEAHGGSIEVGEAEGGGAVFLVRLPIHEASR